MDYKNGKIYRLVVDCEDGTSHEYIGSTSTTLVKRLSRHKALFKMWQNGKTRFVSSFNLFTKGEPLMVLIENYPCSCKNELERRERETIEERRKDGFNVVNIRLPAPTCEDKYKQYKDRYITTQEKSKESRELRKAQRKACQELNKEVNKDKIKQRRKDVRKIYKELNKDKIIHTRKIYKELNRDKLKNQLSEPTMCDNCGKILRKDGMSAHKRTATCLSFKKCLNVVESNKS